MLVDLLSALAAIAWLLFLARPLLVAARMFQIEEYERIRFLAWGIGARWTAHRAVLTSAGIALVGLVLAAVTHVDPSRTVASAWLVASVCGAAAWSWLPPKKPLAYTARMRRLLAATAVLACVLAGGVATLIALQQWLAAALLMVVPLSLTSRLAQTLLVGGDVCMTPIERSVRQRWLQRADVKLRQIHPLVVAVAGSYGKTSTKHILAALLRPSATVLPTRQSFNTLMGITRVINEDLDASHRMFIVEMDAYAPGEIAAMCRLVHPRLSIVTSVGPQHLERFHTLQRIEDALYEAVDALPPDGVAVIFAGDTPTAALAERARRDGRSVLTYGAGGARSFDVTADNVRAGADGARFVWRHTPRGLTYDVSIPLLGMHQVLNVTAALAAAAELGASLEAAVTAAGALQPVEHRLQVLRTGGPVTVIDDSYNANPVGVHNALDVLQTMDGGRKILVTPGLVELGAVEDAENRRYGEHAARVCDEVILVSGGPVVALRDGLRAGGLDDAHVHVVASLAEATTVIAAVSRRGDVVLFANDLPDPYLAGR